MAVLNPYLSFRDNAREAMTFYQSVLGGKLDLVEFSSFPMPHDAADANKIMHSWLETDDGMVLAGSDTPAGMEYQEPRGISVSMSTDDGARAQAIWDGLADGGTVDIPFDGAPWGGRFGMITDRYGVSWMITENAAGE
ncbi:MULTISPECIES: VOC family protein [unclassified Microbacterium]|uniref:VOC family protein n=1 Tax=unclassified Microbacterium TaxID=2609290 RepID=UPI0012F87877|nr:VOC family protein [Microbacterium sp. MAH-37]MVQ42777.1 VOC family protein [Microbacterium sp. MAH-37]